MLYKHLKYTGVLSAVKSVQMYCIPHLAQRTHHRQTLTSLTTNALTGTKLYRQEQLLSQVTLDLIHSRCGYCLWLRYLSQLRGGRHCKRQWLTAWKEKWRQTMVKLQSAVVRRCLSASNKNNRSRLPCLICITIKTFHCSFFPWDFGVHDGIWKLCFISAKILQLFNEAFPCRLSFSVLIGLSYCFRSGPLKECWFETGVHLLHQDILLKPNCSRISGPLLDSSMHA